MRSPLASWKRGLGDDLFSIPAFKAVLQSVASGRVEGDGPEAAMHFLKRQTIALHDRCVLCSACCMCTISLWSHICCVWHVDSTRLPQGRHATVLHTCGCCMQVHADAA